MVSWPTHIMGSPGNWICNRAEICTGDHQSASQLVTWAASGAWASFGVLGRRACSRARWCARHARYWARPPLAATSRDTVEVALPSRAAITVNDWPACRPRVISFRSASVSHPGSGTHPPRANRPPRAVAHDQRDALMRAAHLRADLP